MKQLFERHLTHAVHVINTVKCFAVWIKVACQEFLLTLQPDLYGKLTVDAAACDGTITAFKTEIQAPPNSAKAY